jgi:serine/threonine-protein kinase
MPSERPEKNRVLAGRYRLEELLGEGGMGAIWKAEHLVLMAPVAVKLIDREIAQNEETVARFMREAQAAAALRSPHVVQIIDYGVEDDTPFMVMELLEGENLAQRLQRVGRLQPAETARILVHMARAVGRAHEAGIVHRDLKPENVFLVSNDDEEMAKVLDFGVAKIDSGLLGPKSSHTRTGSLLGTPYYMSPEQAQGNKAVDHRSDLWSLGVIAYECMTGQRPFYSDGLGDLVLQICVRRIPIPSEVVPVPAGFDAWFAKATEREPDQRFQSAREMSDALREALGVDLRSVADAESEAGLRALPPLVASPAPSPSEASTSSMNASAASADPAAATLAALPLDAPVQTIGQFGTSRASDRPTAERSPFALLVMAGSAALVLGVGLGVVLLQGKPWSDADPDPPAKLQEHEPAVPKKGPRPRQAAAGKSSQASQTASERGTDAGGADAAAPAKKDAGWVKPEWARPDDDPEPRGDLDPSPDRAGNPEDSGVHANPY